MLSKDNTTYAKVYYFLVIDSDGESICFTFLADMYCLYHHHYPHAMLNYINNDWSLCVCMCVLLSIGYNIPT